MSQIEVLLFFTHATVNYMAAVKEMLGEFFMKSTIKVFQVLETLCEGKAAGVTELSNQLDIKPSSMHRFLAVLIKLGYVQKNASTGKYFATLKIFQLGVSVRNKLSLISIARSYMEELGEMLNEAVNIAVFTQNNVVVIDRVQSPQTSLWASTYLRIAQPLARSF